MMLVQMWLATSVAQAWSAWSKTLVQAYTALWAAGLIFYAFSGTQAPLGTVSPALRWMADINYWRWCLQFVVGIRSEVASTFDRTSDGIALVLCRSGKS
jgi:hypothetical protein